MEITTAEQFLELGGEVVSGHRDRHVVDTRLGSVRCFLKKEHRVSWSTRTRNWWHGFGHVSLSEREARTLELLRAAGVPVPDWIAYGTAPDGRSFLLLRRVRNAITLAEALEAGRFTDFERWQLARNLGAAIARIHRAGFDAPDLSVKHVLVRVKDRSVVLLDWPRARRIRQLDCQRSLGGLAALHASLPSRLASPRERLLVLKNFLRTLGFHCSSAPIAREVVRTARKLRRRRSIAEQNESKSMPSQRLRWLDGERLCVTRPLWRSLRGVIPSWLKETAARPSPWRTVDRVDLGALGAGFLIQLPRTNRWRRWWGWLSQTPIPCAAVTASGLAFRMQRMGVPVSPVFAFGARSDGSGFMLVRSPKHHRGLREWLALPRPGRTRVIRRLGQWLKMAHRAGTVGHSAESWVVVANDLNRARLRLIPDGRWIQCKRLTTTQTANELQRVARELRLFDRRDLVRLVRGYLIGPDAASDQLRLADAVLRSSFGSR